MHIFRLKYLMPGSTDNSPIRGISGHGVMILDGKEYPFGEGDVNVCRNGGSHGIYNNSDTDFRFLVIAARCKEL